MKPTPIRIHQQGIETINKPTSPSTKQKGKQASSSTFAPKIWTLHWPPNRNQTQINVSSSILTSNSRSTQNPPGNNNHLPSFIPPSSFNPPNPEPALPSLLSLLTSPPLLRKIRLSADLILQTSLFPFLPPRPETETETTRWLDDEPRTGA